MNPLMTSLSALDATADTHVLDLTSATVLLNGTLDGEAIAGEGTAGIIQGGLVEKFDCTGEVVSHYWGTSGSNGGANTNLTVSTPALLAPYAYAQKHSD